MAFSRRKAFRMCRRNYQALDIRVSVGHMSADPRTRKICTAWRCVILRATYRCDFQRALQAASLCSLMRLPSDGRARAEKRAIKLGYLKVTIALYPKPTPKPSPYPTPSPNPNRYPCSYSNTNLTRILNLTVNQNLPLTPHPSGSSLLTRRTASIWQCCSLRTASA